MKELRRVEDMAKLLASMFDSFDKTFGMSEISPAGITGEPEEDFGLCEKKMEREEAVVSSQKVTWHYP